MSAQLPAISHGKPASVFVGTREHRDYVTMKVDDQLFGIPVLTVHDVLRGPRIATVPLAPPEVAGSINLRGRIVTVVDVRIRLGLSGVAHTPQSMGVVVDHKGEMYCLLVDTVGDVLSLPMSQYEKSPANLSMRWRDIASGIFKLEGDLLVIMDVAALLRLEE